jgi:hypothetical protein
VQVFFFFFFFFFWVDEFVGKKEKLLCLDSL